MYNQTTASFSDVINERNQKRKIKILIKYKNKEGTEIEEEISQDEIVSGSFSLVSSCVPSSNIELGGTISKDLSFTIYNNRGKYNGCKFQNGTAKPFIGLVLYDNSVEWCPLGEYIIDESGKTFGKTISIKACDLILKFEKNFDSFEFKNFTLGELLSDMCEDLGVSCDSNFTNSGSSFTAFDRSNLTYRDVLGFIAIAACGFAYVNKSNILEIRTINTSKTQDVELSPMSTRYSCEIDEQIVIDSVAYYMNGEENKLLGDGVYSLTIKNNPLFDCLDNLDDVLNSIFLKYKGFEYYPASIEYMGDPRIEPGDCIFLPTTEAGDVYTFANQVCITLTGTSSISSPSCSVLDKGFFDNKNRKETNKTSGGGGGNQKQEVNPNLLDISLFTKATLPYSYVKVFDDTYSVFNYKTSQGSGGVECLCPAEGMWNAGTGSGEKFPRVWLPASGMVPGKTYTLSLLLRPAIKNMLHIYGNENLSPVNIYLVTNRNMVDMKTGQQHTIAPSLMTSWSGVGYAEILGNILIDSNDWKWYSFTFTYPETKNPEDYQFLGIQQGAGGNWTVRGFICYTFFLHKAKLEEGDKNTGWCYGNNEHISQEVVLDNDGNVKKTIKAKTQSLVAEYRPDMILTGATDIYYDCNEGVTKAGIQETDEYELQFMIKSTNSTELDADGAVFTKQYRDSSNNYHIDCNSLIINGKEHGTE